TRTPARTRRRSICLRALFGVPALAGQILIRLRTQRRESPEIPAPVRLKAGLQTDLLVIPAKPATPMADQWCFIFWATTPARQETLHSPCDISKRRANNHPSAVSP